MDKDYYKILGVTKSSSPDEIKKAYRKLAMQHHPDKGGDHEKFKEINEAYQVLSDPQKKASYDQFGTADFGNQGFGGSQRQGGSYNVNFDDIFSGSGGMGFGGIGDIFEDFFGEQLSQVQVELPITISQAILGDDMKFSTQTSGEVNFKIPAGTQDGQVFRFSNRGKSHKRGKGDLLVTIKIKIPTRISKEEKELYQKIRDIEHEKKGWWPFN